MTAARTLAPLDMVAARIEGWRPVVSMWFVLHDAAPGAFLLKAVDSGRTMLHLTVQENMGRIAKRRT